jgi:hypothetical protein
MKGPILDYDRRNQHKRKETDRFGKYSGVASSHLTFERATTLELNASQSSMPGFPRPAQNLGASRRNAGSRCGRAASAPHGDIIAAAGKLTQRFIQQLSAVALQLDHLNRSSWKVKG